MLTAFASVLQAGNSAALRLFIDVARIMWAQTTGAALSAKTLTPMHIRVLSAVGRLMLGTIVMTSSSLKNSICHNTCRMKGKRGPLTTSMHAAKVDLRSFAARMGTP